MLEVTLIQHPVGQGSMMSGSLVTSGGQFQWVYDCGSNQTDLLKGQIAELPTNTKLDCLFLSHLDSDHINGVDCLLLSTGGSKEVVIPYLNETDKLVAIAHDEVSGTLTGNFLTFLGDIPAWFGNRGVERLTFITPRRDGDSPEGPWPEFPRGGEGGGEGQIIAKWSIQPRQEPTAMGSGQPYSISVQKLEAHACLTLRAPWILNWLFAPYAHAPSDSRLKAFRSAMFKSFGHQYRSMDFISGLIIDKTKLQKLREAYELIWADHNLVSMSLYTGPATAAAWEASCDSPKRARWSYTHYGAVGWLGTGDAQLVTKIRQSAFLRTYRDILDYVNVFCLPHHGSHKNFSPSVPKAMCNISQCVAAAGPNGYGHPHPSVEDAIQSIGASFIHVSHRTPSKLKWTYKL